MTGPHRKYFWGNQIEVKKAERPTLSWLDSIANDMKPIGVKEIEKEEETEEEEMHTGFSRAT
jgi:hypothetical protein